jgi:hypothetical protein
MPNTFVSNTARTSSRDATLARLDFPISSNDVPGLPERFFSAGAA